MTETQQTIILCQPDAGKSCAACCGLYNTTDHTRELVQYNLGERTRLFRELFRSTETWADDYRDLLKKRERPTQKLAEAIYNCPFVGFLNPSATQVGCLLHPRQNHGIDYRDAAFYGKEICASHLCISHNLLSWQEKLAVIKAVDDWYVYGLVITDVDLIKTYFRLIAERLGEEVEGVRVAEEPLRSIVRRFFNYTSDWKFRSGENRLGRYYFSYPEYNIARIDYPLLSRSQPSPYDSILISLSSEFKDASQLQEAEGLIAANIEEFVSAYRLD